MPFLASIAAVAFTIIAAIVPVFGLPGGSGHEKPPFPAPPGYLLPWIGGEIHAVTQGEETGLTHNGLAAYAYDFDLDFQIVVAARGGRVTMVRQDSATGGCGPEYRGSGNYVVIDHGDGTSALYLHLAPAAVLVKPGDLVAQGQGIAVSGESGLTCSADDKAPGPHLHFQVERTDEDRYFTQSLPIAFDDIARDDGVPREGASYMSGNYAPGTRKKIALTPHHDPRPFHPVATPADPSLLEGDPDATPVPTETPPPADVPAEVPLDAGPSTPAPTSTPRPTRTPSPTSTPEPSTTPTPAPSATDTPAATSTPEPPTATPTTEPPTATPTPVPATATDTPPADTATPTPTATPPP